MRSIFFTGEFKRNIRQLAKKYRHIRSDIQPLFDALEQGETPGERIPNLKVPVYKVRAQNSDAKRGKSGGYRIIYYEADEQTRILVTVYSKTEQADVSPKEIAAIITTYEAEQQDQSEDEKEAETQENDSIEDQENR